MEKLPRYFLKISIALLVLSCNGNRYTDLSVEEKKALSKEIFEEEFVKHDHFGPIQGSPESMTLLDEIIELDPANCDALRELSVAYLKRGMPHEWKPRFDKAVACNPKIWQPHRGYLYLWFYRDYKKAIEDFNASDSLTPNFVDAPQGHSVDYWRGIAYLGLKEYSNSRHYFNKHVAKVTESSGEEWVEPNAFLYIGIGYYENSERKLAKESFLKALVNFKGFSADAHYYMALLELEDNNYEAALLSINKAIENYEMGYYEKRDYVEVIRQIYPEQLTEVKDRIKELWK
ncbi:tetratricopeptide repeat protein [Aquimarina sp. 2201CG14-23]|uniref:tetratricopeptide repeat protein n=1 Tax=Aquimarina mycalae TaxID=3040073 RepID=UPI0024781126|nr:hypothetical protein [Aquimarina sp. 2201CG14-23]MDH7446416.1 hypothetical protein [Aquimarina sp. 2201CG14-23]